MHVQCGMRRCAPFPPRPFRKFPPPTHKTLRSMPEVSFSQWLDTMRVECVGSSMPRRRSDKSASFQRQSYHDASPSDVYGYFANDDEAYENNDPLETLSGWCAHRSMSPPILIPNNPKTMQADGDRDSLIGMLALDNFQLSDAQIGLHSAVLPAGMHFQRSSYQDTVERQIATGDHLDGAIFEMEL